MTFLNGLLGAFGVDRSTTTPITIFTSEGEMLACRANLAYHLLIIKLEMAGLTVPTEAVGKALWERAIQNTRFFHHTFSVGVHSLREQFFQNRLMNRDLHFGGDPIANNDIKILIDFLREYVDWKCNEQNRKPYTPTLVDTTPSVLDMAIIDASRRLACAIQDKLRMREFLSLFKTHRFLGLFREEVHEVQDEQGVMAATEVIVANVMTLFPPGTRAGYLSMQAHQEMEQLVELRVWKAIAGPRGSRGDEQPKAKRHILARQTAYELLFVHSSDIPLSELEQNFQSMLYRSKFKSLRRLRGRMRKDYIPVAPEQPWGGTGLRNPLTGKLFRAYANIPSPRTPPEGVDPKARFSKVPSKPQPQPHRFRREFMYRQWQRQTHNPSGARSRDWRSGTSNGRRERGPRHTQDQTPAPVQDPPQAPVRKPFVPLENCMECNSPLIEGEIGGYFHHVLCLPCYLTTKTFPLDLCNKWSHEIQHGQNLDSATFPRLPLRFCTCAKPECGERRVCKHNVETLLRASGEYNVAYLRSIWVHWHPDRFANKCAEEWREQGTQAATVMFQIMGMIIDEEKLRVQMEEATKSKSRG